MKKLTKFLLILLVSLFIIGAGTLYFINKSQATFEHMMSIEIEDLDLSDIDDGIYKGEYSAFPITVIVDVTIFNHAITQIDIIKHDNGKGQAAEAIVDDVILMQSLDIDLISDATYSSKVILLAIDNALYK